MHHLKNYSIKIYTEFQVVFAVINSMETEISAVLWAYVAWEGLCIYVL